MIKSTTKTLPGHKESDVDSLCFKSPTFLKFVPPLAKLAHIHSIGISSINFAIFFDTVVPFRLLPQVIIDPKDSPEVEERFRFTIFTLAFIFFKILTKPILVSLQITLWIVNLDPLVNNVSAIGNAAELGSEPTV